MAYDEKIADRLRAVIEDDEDFTTRKMFGGLAFMLNGHMCCGVIEDQVVLRLGNEGVEAALEDPILEEWIGEAVAFTGALPAK